MKEGKKEKHCYNTQTNPAQLAQLAQLAPVCTLPQSELLLVCKLC